MKKGTTLQSNIEKIYGPMPKQYQEGYSEFYKLKFKVTPNVLIPRPETELLVDEVLHSPITKNQVPVTILDIGTGSGCIAIAIAKNNPTARVIATDISDKALEIAILNAQFHQVEDQVFFFKSDLLSEIKVSPDIIVTNLPYIPTARLLYIDPMVTNFEPRTALDGGRDGFDLYKRLFFQMNEKKIFPKLFLGEIDDAHGQLALQEAKRTFPQAEVEILPDLTKTDRILRIKFPMSNF
jgi:release factor glutamine methyltransferase